MISESDNRIVRTSRTNFFLGILLAGVLLFFILRAVDMQALQNAFAMISWPLFVLSAGFYVLNSLVRAIRFRYALYGKLHISALLSVTFILSFLNSVLPTRTGEFSYVYLVKKLEHDSIAENITSLVVSRLYDVICASLFVLGSIVYVSPVFADWEKIIIVLGVLCVVGIVISCALLFKSDWVRKFFHAMFSWDFLKKFQWIKTIGSGILDIENGIFRMSGFSFSIPLFFLTLLSWFLHFIHLWLLLLSVHQTLSFWAAIFIFALPGIITFLPLQPLFGIGTFEASLGIGFLVLGFSPETALQSSIVLHAGLFAITGFFAILGFCVYSLIRYNTHRQNF